MRAACATLLAAVLALAGCGLESSGKHFLEIGDVSVVSDSPELKREAQEAIGELVAGDGAEAMLFLEETTNVQPASLTSSGRATKRRLRYVLRWRLAVTGGETFTGDYKYNQIVDNDETTHRANRLIDRRLFNNARRDGIQSMLADLGQRSFA